MDVSCKNLVLHITSKNVYLIWFDWIVDFGGNNNSSSSSSSNNDNDNDNDDDDDDDKFQLENFWNWISERNVVTWLNNNRKLFIEILFLYTFILHMCLVQLREKTYPIGLKTIKCCEAHICCENVW